MRRSRVSYLLLPLLALSVAACVGLVLAGCGGGGGAVGAQDDGRDARGSLRSGGGLTHPTGVAARPIA